MTDVKADGKAYLTGKNKIQSKESRKTKRFQRLSVVESRQAFYFPVHLSKTKAAEIVWI